MLSITLLACEMSAVVRLLEHFLALPFFGTGRKLTFSCPVTTAEFSKFADILSVALSQHHFLGFEIAQLEFSSPPLALFIVIFPKAHLNLHSMMPSSR